MGWLYMQMPSEGAKEYLNRQATWENEHTKSEVVASALKQRRVYYAAVRRTWKDGSKEPEVFALICLVNFVPRARDGYTFGYKDMSEEMGPYECDCPAAILDLLTPTDSQYANEWRAKCRARLARVRPKAGQRVTFASPLHFSNGADLSAFVYVKGSRFRSADLGGLYRIRNWQDLAYTVAS